MTSMLCSFECQQQKLLLHYNCDGANNIYTDTYLIELSTFFMKGYTECFYYTFLTTSCGRTIDDLLQIVDKGRLFC